MTGESEAIACGGIAIGQPLSPCDLIFGGPPPDHEYLRFKPDGTILVRGRVAASDLEVVEGVRRWLVSPHESAREIARELAARMLDCLSIREVWNSELWWFRSAGPCGLVGSTLDPVDEKLAAIRHRASVPLSAEALNAAMVEFEERALEIDTECARACRAKVCPHARAAQEIRYGRDWRSAGVQLCERCGMEHQSVIA